MADCIYYASSFDFTTKSKKSKFVIDAFKNVKLFFLLFVIFSDKRKFPIFVGNMDIFLLFVNTS